MSEEETVEVTIKVPKRLMQIIENENYFGWKKEDFWVASTKRSISCEVNAMDFEEITKFYEKYGKNIDVVSFDLVQRQKRLT